jgi:hypothetical protein
MYRMPVMQRVGTYAEEKMQFWYFIFFLSLFISAISYAGPLDAYKVVKLNYGLNRIDFDNDGKEDLVILARRENFNAHGFDAVSFYSEQPQNGNKQLIQGIVSIFDKDKENFIIKVSGGADCVLHDFRLLKPNNGSQTLLIIADRKLSESYYEENAVAFSYYNLEHNSLGEIGYPFLYFKFFKTEQAKRKYCDVNEAFREELGLENYMKKE